MNPYGAPAINRPPRQPGTRNRAGRAKAAAILATVLALGASLLTAAPASAADPLPTGQSTATAAGSCWEVKQNVPSAADGTYWLLTPALQAPEQFYCDMTTDGGGWVLIARGREGWKELYNGLRPGEVRTNVSGTAAFKTAQLQASKVDALLNNGRVDALADGVRVRRASNATGTAYQEVRFKYQVRDRWVWTFAAEHRVSTYSFNGATGSGGQTRNFGNNSGLNRFDTTYTAAQGWTAGMAYGSQITGTNSATTYLYTSTNGNGGARPFAQMYLRPKLKIADMNFGTIPDAGAPATAQVPLAESDAQRTVWGVSGLANGRTGELNTEVSAFGQSGTSVYVGGNFRYVQRAEASTGADKVERPYVAAFNVADSQFRPAFAPVLNDQVKAIAALPDGRVALGGMFSVANGDSHTGIVIVDPTTGATTGWQIDAENRTTGGVAQVRGFSVQGNWLYVSGSYTHLVRQGGITASSWNGGRINLTTGVPDVNWNPIMNGTSVGVDASPTGDRTYFSGYFRQTEETQTLSANALSTAAGADPVTPLWAPIFSKPGVNNTGNIWQLGVREAGGKVWTGGSEHSLFSYDRNNFVRQSGSITKAGGDFQVVSSTGNVVYAGCHCGDWVYENAFFWDNVGTNWTQADKISLVGAWDVATGQVHEDWSPFIQARAGYGAWGLFTDSTGVLWTGGDFSRTLRAGEVSQWSGGFARFAPRDAAAPSRPGTLTATGVDADTARLDWGVSTDNRAVTGYEVLRNNRVVAVTTARTATVPVESDDVRYFVRAVDAAGNRSATTAVAVVSPPSADQLSFVNSSSSWKWRFDSAALPSAWASRTFDDASWASGSSILGFNTAGLGTDISVGAPTPRPLSAQFRTSFNVTSPSTVTNGTVSVIANDGVVVYLNGTEIGRANLPSGTIGQNTYATAAPRSAAAAGSPVTFTVPSSLLVSGTNVIAASSHVNYRSTPDVTFDLSFTAERGTPPAVPAAVTLTGSASDSTTVALAWSHPSGSTAVEYRVSRNGTQIGTVPASTPGYTDSGLSPSTSYNYSVVGVDSIGQTGTPGTVTVTTPAGPPDPQVTLVATNDVWKWRFSGDALPAGWQNPGFDDSAWASGPGVLGFNTPGLGTDISVGAPTPRPLSAQFRTSFQTPDPGEFESVALTVLANDGVIVYVNGTEVGRANLPAGAITQNTYATAAPRSTAAAASPVTFNVPVALLNAGSNTIAAQSNANYRSTPDITFAVGAVGTRG